MPLATTPILVILFFLVSSAAAQICPPNTPDEILDIDAPGWAAFGGSVAVSGDVLVVGATGAGVTSTSGTVYVYRRAGSQWVLEQQLFPTGVPGYQIFGKSVAISGDTILVGAIGDGPPTDFSGAAYIFRYNGNCWTLESKLFTHDAAVNDQLGVSVALEGNIAVVGSRSTRNSNQSLGSAYVFRYNSNDWIEEQKLVSNSPVRATFFGTSVAIDSDRIVVGAFGTSHHIRWGGSAHVFQHDGQSWVKEADILPLDPENDLRFGYSVAIDGDTIVAGTQKITNGKAYIFRLVDSVWTEEPFLSETNTTSGQFGLCVSVSGDLVAVGAPDTSVNDISAGSVFLFQDTGSDWEQVAQLTGLSPAGGNRLGSSLQFDGLALAIGADAGNARNTPGRVFVYNPACKPPCLADTNHDGQLTASDFISWAAAFHINATECDQNADGSCNPQDFNAWIVNFNAGCP